MDMGYCIHCGRGIYLDLNKPLCYRCWSEWRASGFVDYVEHFCHACGVEANVTVDIPLCERCDREIVVEEVYEPANYRPRKSSSQILDEIDRDFDRLL